MTLTASSALDRIQSILPAIRERASQADRQGQLPTEDLDALRQSGYLTSSVPQDYGGWGLSLRDAVAAHLELAQGSGSTALVAGMQVQMLGNMGETDRHAQVYPQFCRWAVEDAALINTAASEPVMGSPSHGAFYATHAVEKDGGWLINGHKTWTTGGKHLTHILVKLKIGDDKAILLVKQDTPGMEWVETWGSALSFRASESNDLLFKDVWVADDQLIERVEPEDRLPNAWYALIMAATYLGVAIGARDDLIRYSFERVPTSLGKPIATLPKIQRQIGEIDIQLQMAQTYLLSVAESWQGSGEQKLAQWPRIMAAKVQAIETANRVTEQALRTAGGPSITTDLPLERHFRDVRAGLMQPPSSEAALESNGRAAIDRIAPLDDIA
ncbi:MAG: acyl-CoA/acyl-ACP dehydrogenase [Chloroflexi bacterium]|nr:acyl-CoA/acyl-ACP dehydrogenase [Chloroflexota bacterium]